MAVRLLKTHFTQLPVEAVSAVKEKAAREPASGFPVNCWD